MRHPRKMLALSNLEADQKGITGLETAIVLIAFVVVASVFAFAVLSTGLTSSQKSQEAVLGALEETSATLNVRGAVIASVNAALTGVDTIKFNLSSASDTAEPVEVSSAAMVITYLDADQALNVASSDWTATWLTESGDLLNAGEQVEIVVTLTKNRERGSRRLGSIGARETAHPNGAGMGVSEEHSLLPVIPGASCGKVRPAWFG